MPAGIEAVIEDGFATLDFIDRSLVGPSLAKLAAQGSRVTKETRTGPRARYTMPEGDAVAAGLLDGATVKPPALAFGDTGAAAVLQGVGMAGARPEQPTIRNHYSGATPASAVMAIPGPSTTVSGSKPTTPAVTPAHAAVTRPRGADSHDYTGPEIVDYVEPTTLHSPAPARPTTTEGILIDVPAQIPGSGVQTSVPKVSAPDSSWTVADLKQYAADNGIDLGAATKKSDILAAIQAAG